MGKPDGQQKSSAEAALPLLHGLAVLGGGHARFPAEEAAEVLRALKSRHPAYVADAEGVVAQELLGLVQPDDVQEAHGGHMVHLGEQVDVA